MPRIITIISSIILSTTCHGQTLKTSDADFSNLANIGVRQVLSLSALDSSTYLSAQVKFGSRQRQLRIHNLNSEGVIETSEPCGEVAALTWLNFFKWNDKYYSIDSKGNTKNRTAWIQEVDERDLTKEMGEKITVFKDEAGFTNFNLFKENVLLPKQGKLFLLGEELGKSKNERTLKYFLFDLNSFQVEKVGRISVPESITYSQYSWMILADGNPVITLYKTDANRIVLEYIVHLNTHEFIDVNKTRKSEQFETLIGTMNNRDIVTQLNLDRENLGFQLKSFRATADGAESIDAMELTLEELLKNNKSKNAAKYLTRKFRGGTLTYRIINRLSSISNDGIEMHYITLRFDDEKAGTIFIDLLYRMDQNGGFEWVNTDVWVGFEETAGWPNKFMRINEQGETLIFFNTNTCYYNEIGDYDSETPQEKGCRSEKVIAQIKISREGEVVEKRLLNGSASNQEHMVHSLGEISPGENLVIVAKGEGREIIKSLQLGAIKWDE